jgi:hypothetical protein
LARERGVFSQVSTSIVAFETIQALDLRLKMNF